MTQDLLTAGYFVPLKRIGFIGSDCLPALSAALALPEVISKSFAGKKLPFNHFRQWNHLFTSSHKAFHLRYSHTFPCDRGNRGRRDRKQNKRSKDMAMQKKVIKELLFHQNPSTMSFSRWCPRGVSLRKYPVANWTSNILKWKKTPKELTNVFYNDPLIPTDFTLGASVWCS